ncbi:MAG TPA: tripartite tricarboxylate transporter substrate binding protein [Pseudorhodoferax sp.]|nr:tripartite tricarboxylate transporter substrate binding protein [Pseudorhodoferax sp.]
MSRKQFLCTLALLGASLAAPAFAQGDYPNRPVKLVVPFSPGGNTDVIARMLAQGMAEQLGQPVIVENLAGANGSIGASRVAGSPNDGYTLLFGTAGTQAINQSLYRNLGEKNLGEYEYVALVTSIPNVLVVNESKTPARTVAELVAAERKRRGGLSYGSPGAGSTVHLSGELFKTATQLDLLHVPYKGSAPALTDLMGGQIDFIFENVTPALPFVQSGKLRALAVTSAERIPALPNVPTMKESGYPDFVTATWNGVLAPKGTPPAILKRLQDAASKVAGSADFKTRVTALGGEVRLLDSAAFRDFARAEYQHWGTIIKNAGVTVQ